MKVLFYLIFASLLAASCNPQNKDADKTATDQSNAKKPSSINCYSYATVNDTINLKVINAGDSITGILVYALKEKDRNKGTIQGNMQGDILVANYTFMSEGIVSTRQVAFKKIGNSFIEGYGDFKSIDSLKFNTSMKLVEITCQ